MNMPDWKLVLFKPVRTIERFVRARFSPVIIPAMENIHMTYSDFLLNVRLKAWEEEREVLQTIGEGIDLHFDLFRHPWKLAMNENNRREQVWLGLTTSGFHSLRIAVYALESGYYTQCFILTRAALEHWLTAHDCKSNPKTVEALLELQGRVPRFSTMAERLPENLKALWKDVNDPEGTYGFLSTFAHPRSRALEATSNEAGTVLIVPEYDEMRFALAAKLLLQTVLLLFDYVERLADYLATPASVEWKSRSLEPVKAKCFALFDSLLHRLNSYMPDPEQGDG